MQDFMDLVLRTAPDMLFIAIDNHGVITYCSPLTDGWLDCQPDQLIGQSVESLRQPILGLFRETDWRGQLDIAKEELEWVVELDTKGTKHLIATRLAPLIDEQGDEQGYLFQAWDVFRLGQSRLLAPHSRLQQAMEIAKLGSWELDLRTRKAIWSSETRRVIGVPEDAPAAPETLLNRVHPADRGRVSAAMKNTISNTRPYDIVYKVIHPDGSVHILHSRADLVVDGGGQPLKLVGFVQDVTKQKNSERQLAESEAIYRSLIDEIDDVIFRLDDEARWTFLNSAWETVTGIPIKDALGKFCPEFVLEEDREPAKEMLASLLRGESDYYQHRMRLRQRDNGYRWCEVRIRLMTDVDADETWLSGVLRDVTDRVEADATSIQNEERLWTLLENMPVMLNAVDADRNILVWNQECERVTGYSKAEVEGNPGIWEKFYPDREYREALFTDWRNEDKLRHREYVLHAKDGSVRCIAWTNVSKHVPIPGWFSWSIGQDVTEQKHAKEALLHEANAWIQAMDQFNDPIYLLDMDRRFLRANRAFYEVAGIGLESVVGQRIAEFCHPGIKEKDCPACQAEIDGRDTIITLEAEHPGNPLEHPIEISIKFIRDSSGNPTGILESIHDLSRIRKLEQETRLAASVFNTSLNAILITDTKGVIRQVNQAFTDTTGYRADEVIGKTPKILRSEHHDEAFYDHFWRTLEQDGHWEGEIWDRDKAEEVFPAWQSVSAVRDAAGRTSHYISTFTDITEQKLSADRIYRLAHYDVLTNLPNRILFNERCKHALERARRDGGQVALLFIDIDRFKHINDSLGHPAGDILLGQVAQRLKRTVREEDTVARLGGDEFVIALEQVADERDPERVAVKISEMFQHPVNVHGHELVVSASIGISMFPLDGDDVTTLIKHADVAMYRAKDKGRDNFQFFSAEFSNQVLQRLMLETDLRHALERNELVLIYQPQYELKSGKLVGAEALIRWRHKERGMVPPGDFIPVAEESGLILPIGEWVLRTACVQAKRWLNTGSGIQRVAVNLSGLQLQRGNIVVLVQSVLEETGLPPDCLELEILETYIMQHADQDIHMLEQLRDIGVRLAIDDFGTGQSSLGYLKRLPVEKLKIDRSFVMDIPEDVDDTAIAKAILALGQSLQLTIVAEGVENEAQVSFLRELECDQVQGFYYSVPLPAQEFEQLLFRKN